MKELAGQEGYHADATKIWDAQGLVHAFKAPSGQWVDLRATDAQGNVIEGAWSYTFSDGYSIPPMRVFATEKDAARCIIANSIHWGEVRDFGPASQTSADSQFVSRQHWNSFPIKPGHEHIPSNVYYLSSQGKTAYLRSIDIDVTAIPFDGIQIWWRNQTTGNLDRVLVIGVDINRTNGVSVP